MDLELKDVAELLNVSESTVQDWLAKEEIPAYRIHDQVRFSQAEIEDWLMHKKLEPAFLDSKNYMQFSLYRALYRGKVHTDVTGNSKQEVIQKVLEQMGSRFEFDPIVLAELFLDREKMMPTTLGCGIGVPHTRDFLLDTHYDVVELVYPEEPLEYGALDGEKVHTLFFLFASEDKRHLNLLAKIAHLNARPEAREFFKSKPPKDKVLEFVKQWESSLS